MHKLIIESVDCTHKCITAENGIAALDALTKETGEGFLCPELIFLDINMPKMNGWEFLEEYKKLDPKYHGKSILVMLTTSMNPEDRKKAEDSEFINGFISKPLSKDSIKKVIEEHFSMA